MKLLRVGKEGRDGGVGKEQEGASYSKGCCEGKNNDVMWGDFEKKNRVPP